MRSIHFAASGRAHAEPLCGTWGSMDTDWTDAAGGVTCPGCQAALRDLAQRAAGSSAGPPGQAPGSGG